MCRHRRRGQPCEMRGCRGPSLTEKETSLEDIGIKAFDEPTPTASYPWISSLCTMLPREAHVQMPPPSPYFNPAWGVSPNAQPTRAPHTPGALFPQDHRRLTASCTLGRLHPLESPAVSDRFTPPSSPDSRDHVHVSNVRLSPPHAAGGSLPSCAT